MKIIDRIFLLMDEKDIRPVDLANALGIRTSVISNWKSRRSDPPSNQIVQICDLLGVSVDYLLTGKEDSTKVAHPQNKTLNSEDKEILDLWHCLSYENKAIVKGKMFELKKEQDNKNKYPTENLMVAE